MSESKSTHRVEIVPVEMRQHPNADLLSVIPVFGYTYVGRTSDWAGVKKAAYIPPDSLVDVKRPEFAFLAERAKLDGFARIKAMRLRGVVSYGLMVPVPDETPLGDDWAERLGVKHYEPELNLGKGKNDKFFMGGEAASGPSLLAYKYDLDAFQRYHHMFVAGEPVRITEKCDGANARFVCYQGQMYCGSRTEWKKEFPSYEHVTVEHLTSNGVELERAKEIVERLHAKPKQKNLWWEVLSRTPSLEKFCRDHPDHVVYGEVFGNVNCIKYGFPEGNRFAAFDILKDGQWMDADEARDLSRKCSSDFAWVPDMPCSGKYDFDELLALADGPTLVQGAKPGVIREGVVVKPLRERSDDRIGRVCLKIVSPTYLEKYR